MSKENARGMQDDVISREQVIEALGELATFTEDWSCHTWMYTDDVYNAIKQLPPIHPVNNSEMPNGSDVISRQAAIDALCTITMYKGSIPFNTAVMRIEQLPSAQPAPIKIDCGKFTKEDGERIKKDLAKVPVHVFSAQLDVHDKNVGELISRQQAIETFKDCAVNGVGIDGIVDALEQLPQIQPKRGRWISADAIFGGVPFYCSECGENTRDTVMGKPRWKFCPMCGAKMEGADDE